MCTSRPEFSTEVVDARMIDCGAGCSAAIVACASSATNNEREKLPEFHQLSQSTKALALTAMLIPIRMRPSAERQPQLALARLQHDRCRHNARVARDVAADNEDRADFGDRAAEAGQHCGHDRAARDC